SPQLLRSSITGVKNIPTPSAGHLREDVVLLLIVEEFRNGELQAAGLASLIEVVDFEDADAVSVPVRKRTQEGVIHHAENHCGGADPEGQGEDRDQREPRTLGQ